MSSRLKFDVKHQWHRSQFPSKPKAKRYRPPARTKVYS